MKIALTAVLLLSATGLAACQTTTPTPFAAAAGPTAPGYYEYRIEPGRYRITFRGGRGAPANQVQDYALLRAADIALREGYDWFEVTEGYGEQRGANNGPRITLGGGSDSYGTHTALGVGIGASFDLSGPPAFTNTIEVVLGKGPRPDRSTVYDARGVRANIGSHSG